MITSILAERQWDSHFSVVYCEESNANIATTAPACCSEYPLFCYIKNGGCTWLWTKARGWTNGTGQVQTPQCTKDVLRIAGIFWDQQRNSEDSRSISWNAMKSWLCLKCNGLWFSKSPLQGKAVQKDLDQGIWEFRCKMLILICF